MAEENRKYWVSAQIEEDDRDAIMMIASHEGKHVTKIIEDAVQVFIGVWVADEDNPDDKSVQLRKMYLESRQAQNRFVMLKQLAYQWQRTQSDEDYEILQKACDLAGVEMDVVFETINKNANMASLSVISTSATGLQSAEMWLEELLIDTGRLYPVNEIKNMAIERGYKWHTVTEAKRRRKIQSVKDGLSWYWIRSPSENPISDDIAVGDDIF